MIYWLKTSVKIEVQYTDLQHGLFANLYGKHFIGRVGRSNENFNMKFFFLKIKFFEKNVFFQLEKVCQLQQLFYNQPIFCENKYVLIFF